MPITSIRLQNFRCFRDTKDLPLKPLTVVFGRNNAGKSSIIHSLFLLRQTLDRPEGPRLNLRGPLYPAGSYGDVVHQHRSSVNIKFHFRVEAPPERHLRSWGGPTKRSKEHISTVGDIGFEFSSDEPRPPRLVRFDVSIGGRSIEVVRGRGRGGPYELRIDGKAVNERHPGFIFRPSGFLPFFTGGPVGPGAKGFELREDVRNLLREFQSSLERMRAVGAFRRAPDRRYDYEGRPESIDLSGALVVSALIDDSLRRGKTRGTLLSALNRWLARVGRVKVMPLRRISRDVRLYEVRLKDLDSGRWANFADVGFGIGQALPVLVEGLRTTDDGLFVVQEPEIHLHPDAQLAMADFLIELALSGRRIVVETHSEALLLRIRKAVAESALKAKGGLQASDVSVLYVAATRDGVSKVKELTIDEIGDLGDWPHGFMDELSQERLHLLKAAAEASEEAAGK